MRTGWRLVVGIKLMDVVFQMLLFSTVVERKAATWRRPREQKAAIVCVRITRLSETVVSVHLFTCTKQKNPDSSADLRNNINRAAGYVRLKLAWCSLDDSWG